MVEYCTYFIEVYEYTVIFSQYCNVQYKYSIVRIYFRAYKI